MLIRKSVPYYTNHYLSNEGKPSFNRDRSLHRQRDGVIKRDRSPVPNLKIPVPRLKINGAEKRKSTSHIIKRDCEYRIPAANQKKSSPAPQKMNWNGERLDSELNELDWLALPADAAQETNDNEAAQIWNALESLEQKNV